MKLTTKSAATVDCNILGMHACSKGVTVLSGLQVQVMRKQGSLFAPLEQRDTNTSDQRSEKQKKYNFHNVITSQKVAFLKSGAQTC